MMSKPKPVYLLAGGRQAARETTYSLVQKVFKENEVASPSVAYVGTANEDNEAFFQRTADILKAAGAGKVNHTLI